MNLARTPVATTTLAVVSTFTVAACAGDVGATGAADGEELNVAVAELAASLDPAAELSASYLRAAGAAEGLMKILPDGSVQPELAVSLTQDSPRTWTVTLDPERTFWSGDPVDAEAVEASLSRAVELNELAKAQLEGVQIDVLDQATVQLSTPQPRPSLPYALAHYQLVIHNAQSYGQAAGVADVERSDLTGPYEIEEFHTGRRMLLTAHDEW